MKDSLWSLDLFQCESAALRTYRVLVVMDQFTRRIGFGVQRGIVNGVAYLSKLSDRDLQNPNGGEALRKAFGDAEAAQLQPIGNRSIRNRQTLFLNYRPELSHPKGTVSSSN